MDTENLDTIIFKAYLDRLNRLNRDPRTISNARRALAKLLYIDLEGVRAQDVTPAVVDDYLDWMLGQHKPATVAHHLVYVRSAYARAVKRGAQDKDPTYDAQLPLVPDVEPETFTNEELRRVLAAARTDQESLLAHLLIYTGCRRNEIRCLRWEAREDGRPCSYVDLPNSTLTIFGKGSKIRRVPVHPALGEVLKLAHENRGGNHYVLATNRILPVSTSTMTTTVRRLVKTAGASGACHKFRKTFATCLDEAEVRESVIDQICGWAPWACDQGTTPELRIRGCTKRFCGCMPMTHSVWRQRSGRNGCG